MKVDNAIILAAGTSSRFAPLSYEKPKGLFVVKGEVLIERQIRQLQESGISDIYVVTGYKADQFEYLKERFGVHLLFNPDYNIRNNHSSIWVVKEHLKNSFVCSSDNYFVQNPFSSEVDEPYYAAVYVQGMTNEWCLTVDDSNYITSVQIGGRDSWIMLGHTFWDEKFSQEFLSILQKEYENPSTANQLWEHIYINNLSSLKMKIRKYNLGFIFEFDTLDELRTFDKSYIVDSKSNILKEIAGILDVEEYQIIDAKPITGFDNLSLGFTFSCKGNTYSYIYNSKELILKAE